MVKNDNVCVGSNGQVTVWRFKTDWELLGFPLQYLAVQSGGKHLFMKGGGVAKRYSVHINATPLMVVDLVISTGDDVSYKDLLFYPEVLQEDPFAGVWEALVQGKTESVLFAEPSPTLGILEF